MLYRLLGGVLLAAIGSSPAQAQRTNEDVVAQADDAFGVSIGNERVGLYSASDVRGFSPATAGNIRLEDLYYDRAGSFTDRLHTGTTIRVGLTSQDYLFPAPTGIAEYRVRRAGKKPLVSVLLGYGTLGGGRIEVDAELPLDPDRLGLTAGIGFYADELPAGNGGYFVSLASAMHWRPGGDVEVIPFWSRIDGIDREAMPVFVPGSDRLPPRVERRRFIGPAWTDARTVSTNMGIVTRGGTGNWETALGVFRSVQEDRTGFVDLVAGIDPSGQANRLVTSQPSRQQSSTSGEARVGRRLIEGNRLHRITLALRGRDRHNEYGGGRTIDFGPQPFDAPLNDPKPDFSFGRQTNESVTQWTPGLGYGLQWRGVGSLQLGAQWTDYRKRIFLPGGNTAEAHEQAWLFNAAASIQLASDLALYGSYARGLEESGIAPDTVINRGEALPAIFTRQVDAGLRWVLPNSMRLVAGAFEIEKPYFAANEENRFVELGTVRHRGLEFSLSGSPAKRLSLLAGAVFMQPDVTGLPVEQGRIGRRPVGQTGTILTLSGNYDVIAVEGLALTFAANHRGNRLGDRLNRVMLPPVTTLEAGLRYRFHLGEVPSLLRFRVTNLTNAYEWQVVSSGSYAVTAPRSFTLFLTMDL
ncbi:TonB-dependent receptor domain-containing protein [Altericroceibacterium xinjiangense]|uniref:TonB-dependent receptor domain-containing protein n=1 Tax=Altericroceibacterium xinjiangense TaxID=762261 RepID=UPI000F7E45A3|nr:TonB-dependent receptor [Altericroceibacterium xinjiangense]